MSEAHTSAVGGTKSHRIYLLLKDAILSGRLPSGGKLPGENRLAEQHGVSRVTVRRAIKALQASGLVERKAGVGTVVLKQPLEATVMTANVSNLMPNMVKMSQASQVRLLEFGYAPPPETIAERLGMAPNTKAQRSVRVRMVDGNPFSYLITHVPEKIALHYSEADLADTPLFVLLERSGVNVDHASQSISATLASHDLAQALEVSVGSPLISLTRVVFDEKGRGVEHLEAFYRPDRYRFQIDLERNGDDSSRYWEPRVGGMPTDSTV
ncbi:GntR family transcriptional regulator [Halomonas sp. PAMB 3264]|uniref:GntR family transcriptional regulator n=1 Tax=unclassified Halomonas TaxID=2609666 RepID=UPI0028997C40|nr:MULTISPECIES: GntR family transcriptional regulator [unclassified Halomonas]WNL39555.1 GntR family transcriptional regulator [Halomonas sp. PAMB 3232]WNL42912.1 GntR family transcriptional regulator [Halomonas sp. PAMB 3264]